MIQNDIIIWNKMAFPTYAMEVYTIKLSITFDKIIGGKMVITTKFHKLLEI